MMRAIVQHAYGASDVLRLQDIDEPIPRPHEVLVRVHAASINHGDCFVTSGRPYVMHAALGLRRPRVAVREDRGDEIDAYQVPDRMQRALRDLGERRAQERLDGIDVTEDRGGSRPPRPSGHPR